MRKRRRRKKENGEGKGPKSFQSLIGFNRPSYKYASQIHDRRRKGEAVREKGGSNNFNRPSYKYATQISERRSEGEEDSRPPRVMGSRGHGNSGKSDIGGENGFGKVDSIYDIDVIDDLVSRNFERDHESGDYDSHTYDSGDPVSREHDRDYESSVPDHRNSEGDGAELTDGFEVEFGDWLSKFGVDRTTQSPPRRRRLTSDQEVKSVASPTSLFLIYS